MKRTLCKRCCLPLLPGVNTTLVLEEKQKPPNAKQEEKSLPEPTTTTRKRRIRRLRSKRNKNNKIDDASVSNVAPLQDDQVALQVECNMCSAKRRFQVGTQNECWPEREQAIVQTVTLDRQADGAAAAGEETRE